MLRVGQICSAPSDNYPENYREAEGDKNRLALLKKISPAAWRHIHFQGHLIFSNDGKMLNLTELVKKLVLSDR